MVYCWIYVSRSLLVSEAVEAEIDKIVEISQARNANLGVTGGLVFSGTRFAQLLEGGKSEVLELKSSISGDVRHKDVTTIMLGSAAKRLFVDWSMVYSGSVRYFSKMLDRIRLSSELQSDRAVSDLMEIFRQFSSQSAREQSYNKSRETSADSTCFIPGS